MIFTILYSFMCLALWGQLVWHNPVKEHSLVIRNQGFPQEAGLSYNRLPQRAQQKVRPAVWKLSRHSSGLSIRFQSNAVHIKIRYGVSTATPRGLPHMPPTGVSGIDMYRIEGGKWSNCAGSYVFNDTIMYSYDNLSVPKQVSEYCIFLPLYNEVTWMEIGVEEKCNFHFIPLSTKKPIVIYGTSIVQGACASRPGMAWGNIIQRYIDCPVVNLGFSGNGKLEENVIELINEIDACLYILDCVSNLTRDSLLQKRIVHAVKQIRAVHKDTPILIMEHAGYSNSMTNLQRKLECKKANKCTQQAYQKLILEDIKNVFYISKDDFNFPDDAWVDYVHPSDIGMQRKALVIKDKLLHLHDSNILSF